MARKQPVDFRKAEISWVMQCWLAGDSCSLVGVGSIGKSNLIQHLTDPDVREHYLGDAAPSLKPIVIDPNMLGALPEEGANAGQIRAWAGYELMMHRLFLALYPFDMLSQEEARHFYDAYQSLQDGSNSLYAYMGLRYFELGLQIVLRRGLRVVFMFDELEDLLRQMPIRFFQALRGLRDANKRQIGYLTLTRAPLPHLVERLGMPGLDMESFVELFTDHILYVGPYSEADARRMVDEVSSRGGMSLDSAQVDYLLRVTGRYAGLLRAATRSGQRLVGSGAGPESQQTELTALAGRPAVRAECVTIWSSLNGAEQYVLRAVARVSEYRVNEDTEQAVTQLVMKRLLRVDRASQHLEIEPPLFRAFVEGGV